MSLHHQTIRGERELFGLERRGWVDLVKNGRIWWSIKVSVELPRHLNNAVVRWVSVWTGCGNYISAANYSDVMTGTEIYLTSLIILVIWTENKGNGIHLGFKVLI